MEEIQLEGCNFFRQHIVYSLLSGCAIKIANIRKYDEPPGLKDFERKFISVIELLTNGTEIRINKSGTFLSFKPGILHGGEIEIDCGTERNISYFLEPLMLTAPFCKHPLNLRLKGITNSPEELSVDALNAIWLPLYSRFVMADADPSIKINARGFLPGGGGLVTFSSPIKRNLRAVQCVKPGKICKIRGLAYVSKISPSIASRMIEGAKKMLHGYIADIYITVDQRKGQQGGFSPGFGIFIFAESTEGIFYHGEAMSNPKGTDQGQAIPEEVGQAAAKRLLSEIYKGGCTDSSAQILATTFMTLCDKDVSKFLLGPLTIYWYFYYELIKIIFSVHTLRNLKLFFNHMFKLDEFWKVENEINGEKKKLQTGSENKCLLTCTGIGYYNINKVIL